MISGTKYFDFKNRPYAMYHSQTSQVIKDHILASFSKTDGLVRVLVASIAFGMGVDCKGLKTVIHYGPSSTIEDYFQETGRAGRNGEQSYAILLDYSGCTRSKNIKTAIKKYLRNHLSCRRELLLSIFGIMSHTVPQVSCCDICSKEDIDLELIQGFQSLNCQDSEEEYSSSSDSSNTSNYKCVETLSMSSDESDE